MVSSMGLEWKEYSHFTVFLFLILFLFRIDKNEEIVILVESQIV